LLAEQHQGGMIFRAGQRTLRCVAVREANQFLLVKCKK